MSMLARLLLIFVLVASCAHAHAQPVGGGAAPRPSVPSDLALEEAPRTVVRVDASRLFPALSRVRGDERGDQLLDWAVYAVLAHHRVGASTLRDAVFDVPALRRADLDDLAGHSYGPGRFVVLEEGRVAVVYSVYDTCPRQSIARMADQARQLLRATPATFELWRTYSDLPNGQLVLERLADRPASEIFGAAFGFVERPVSSVEDLRAFLDLVDDLTVVERAEGTATLFGGRRFPSARTAGVTLDDVAALMNAQDTITRRWGPLLSGESREQELVDGIRALIRIGNASITQRVATSTEEFDRGVARLETLIGGADRAVTQHTTVEAQARAVRSLQPRVQTFHERMVREFRAAAEQMRADPIPQEPGFSLDPAWRKDALIADLQRIVRDPAGLLRDAHARAAAWTGPDPLREGGPAEVRAAKFLQTQIPLNQADALARIVAPWSSRVEATVAAVRAASPDALDAPVFQLRHAITDAASRGGHEAQLSAAVVEALFDFATHRNRVQCARYDGPLQGTHAAMTLFYTDFVAKVWAGLDYRHQAPRDAVAGFWPLPPIAERFRAQNPTRDVPERTRIWFGPRVDRMSVSPRSGLLFAPLSTKIFAAGSDPASRGHEGIPGEPIRRVLSWWDRNYLRVADHEPEYHRLNEITKWSLTTAWLAREGRLPGLARVAFDHAQRFDTWVQGNARRLRFSQGVDVLPQAQWVGQTECIDVLSSYSINHGGSSISGGVNSGGIRTLDSLVAPAEAASITGIRPATRPIQGQPGVVEMTTRFVQGTVPREPAATRDASAHASLRLVGDERIAAARAAHRATHVDVTAEVTAESLRVELRPDQGDVLTLTARANQAGVLEVALHAGDQHPPQPSQGPPLTAVAFASAHDAATFQRLLRRAISPQVDAVALDIAARTPPPSRELLFAAAMAFTRLGDTPRSARGFFDAFEGGTPDARMLQVAVPMLEAMGESQVARLAKVHAASAIHTDIDASAYTLGTYGARTALERQTQPTPYEHLLPSDAAYTAVSASRNGGRNHIYGDASGIAASSDPAAAPVDFLLAAIRSGEMEVIDTGLHEPEGVHADVLRRGEARYWHLFSDDSGDLSIDPAQGEHVLIARRRN